MPETKAPVKDEVKARLELLETLKSIFISHLSGRCESWDGNVGPMYNLFLKNQHAESPIKKMTNRDNEVVEINTIGELARQVTKNLKKSGFWIHFNINKPDGKGGVIPIKVDMWSFSERDGGYIVCKGRDAFTTSVSGSVSKTEPKKVVVKDEQGNETEMKDYTADFSLFSGSQGNVSNVTIS